MKEEKQYAVYGHVYNDVIFYIGSGIYNEKNIYKSRAYNFYNSSRSEEWFKFCNNEIDQVKVHIFYKTNDRKKAFDKEEELTQYYFDHKVPLVNIQIGTKRSEKLKKQLSLARSGEKGYWYGKRGKGNPMYGKKHSEETLKQMSLANKGEKNGFYGKKHNEETREQISLAQKGKPKKGNKVFMINNKTKESKVFDSITKAYQFIVENGFDKAQSILYWYLNKGQFNFENYTMELIA